MFWLLDHVAAISQAVGSRHLALCVALVLYTALGGVLFVWLEADNDAADRRVVIADRAKQRQQFVLRIQELQVVFRSGAAFNSVAVETEKAVSRFERSLVDPISTDSAWDIWTAIFYCSTISTTIGYGDLPPATVWGKIATVLYACFGIPLVVSILNDWGKLLYRLMQHVNYGWNRCLACVCVRCPKCCRRNCCRCCLPTVVERPPDDAEPLEEAAPEQLPLWVTVWLLVFWFGLSAAVFCLWEDWTYYKSLYFIFISLTTIGLGDVVPQQKRLAVFSLVVVLVGLSVVSMGINVLQTRLEGLFEAFVGMIDAEYSRSLAGADDSQMAVMGVSGGEAQPAAAAQLQQLMAKQPFAKRLLLKFMGEHKKKMLEERWEARARLRNRATQTGKPTLVEFSMQTGGGTRADPADDAYDPTADGSSPLATSPMNRSYIYNVGE